MSWIPGLRSWLMARDQQTLGITVLAAAIVAASFRFVPFAVAPLTLLTACIVICVLVRANVGPPWTFYLTGLIYWTAAVAALNLMLRGSSFAGRNYQVLAVALILSLMWRKRILSEWGVPALAYSLGLLAIGTLVGATALSLSLDLLRLGPAPSIVIAGILIAASGQPIADTIGVWFPLRTAPKIFTASAVALWLALGQLGNSLWLELPFTKDLPPRSTLLVCSVVAGICGVLVRRQGGAKTVPLRFESDWKARTAAALSYWLVGLLALILPSYRRNALVRFHAAQAVLLYAVLFGVTFFLAFFAVLTPSGFVLVGLVKLGLYVGVLFMTVQAARGKMTRLPGIGTLAARIAAVPLQSKRTETEEKARPMQEPRPQDTPPPETPVELPQHPSPQGRLSAYITATPDKLDDRTAVIVVLRQLSLDVRLNEPMFAFGEVSETKAKVSMIGASVFIAIVGWSFSAQLIKEYVRARRLSIPMLIFIDKKPPPDRPVTEALQAFRERFLRETVVNFFVTAEELQAQVAAGIEKLHPSPGKSLR